MEEAMSSEQLYYIEEIYELYKKSSKSVSAEWREYFKKLDSTSYSSISTPVSTSKSQKKNELFSPELGIQSLLNTYRRYGHLSAQIDPLNFREITRSKIENKKNILKEKFNTIIHIKSPFPQTLTLKELIEKYEKIYCGSIGIELLHINNQNELNWLVYQLEGPSPLCEDKEWLSEKEKKRIFEKMWQGQLLEQFLAKKYIGKKRFSIEGGESLISSLDTLVQEASQYDVKNIVIGMAHRGRLNVLTNILEKPLWLIFAEFEENRNEKDLGKGDVKYHLGYSNYVTTIFNKKIKLSLAFNPSHLEAADPVVMGSVRARQTLLHKSPKEVLGVLIHGDAAFAGQGVIAESLNLNNLKGYTIGGCIHIVVNNQIGFTTSPDDSRSTLYATGVAKGYEIPIIHVNGDDSIACSKAMKLALKYRNKFKKDFIIDIYCYRRLGHNETDEPMFTQPKMYTRIKDHPTSAKILEDFLLSKKVITKDYSQKIKQNIENTLEKSFKMSYGKAVNIKIDSLTEHWQSVSKEPTDIEPDTTLLREQLLSVSKAMTTIPKGFALHPKIKRQIEQKKTIFQKNGMVDWGTAETLAFGSILESGYHIRFSGQDSQRGTFSHRHAIWIDTNTGDEYVPLQHISKKQSNFEIINSPLSEYAVLGFEYGYSLAYPNCLIIWEAQFGDFANGAQIIFDQFLSSSEEKWNRMSGIVVLLPHGYEGQGPEHSSARLERFLSLCANNNMLVCNCTTPSQFFHLLRRQILRNFRKPLIVMTPKSLLRHKEALSPISEITEGNFRTIIKDISVKKQKNVTRIILCSGKIYYPLNSVRIERKIEHIAILRIEQIYPFPKKKLIEILGTLPSLKECYWVQEESHNMGAWYFIRDIFSQDEILPSSLELQCISRSKSASPASGFLKIHAKEEIEIVDKALV